MKSTALKKNNNPSANPWSAIRYDTGDLSLQSKATSRFHGGVAYLYGGWENRG